MFAWFVCFCNVTTCVWCAEPFVRHHLGTYLILSVHHKLAWMRFLCRHGLVLQRPMQSCNWAQSHYSLAAGCSEHPCESLFSTNASNMFRSCWHVLGNIVVFGDCCTVQCNGWHRVSLHPRLHLQGFMWISSLHETGMFFWCICRSFASRDDEQRPVGSLRLWPSPWRSRLLPIST
jgi:hypothetical protein